MSYEIDIREELIIHNVNDKTRAAAARLAEYIRQFNKMDGLSGMQIYSMELAADEKIAWADDEISSKECGYIFTDTATGAPLVKLIEEDYTHWDEEEDVQVILNHLETAREIRLRMDCSLLVTSETSYGVAFWQEYLERMEPEDFGPYITYRSAEFYTPDDPVCFYTYMDGNGETPAFTEGMEAVSDCRFWHSYCLQMKMEGLDGSDDVKRLAVLADDFSAKYDLETGSSDIANGSFVMDEELGLLEGEEKTLITDLQQFADFAASVGAVFSLRGEFFSDTGDFEFLSIGAEEGKVQVKSCKF
ncbi:MAG: hypothetical protein ACI4WY_05665 [Anaerovoracaceae bacterium]